MRPYIENIVNVKMDGNCGFHVIARHMGMDEENHILVRSALIPKLKTNKRDYLPIFGSEEPFQYIMNDLRPPTNSGGIAYLDKWLTLPDMRHIVVICYNSVVVQVVFPERGIYETFFPFRGAPPLNPHAHIMCLGLIPGHFLHVYLKDDCRLPPSCMEWKNHKIGEAERWEFEFLDRQALFKDIMSMESKPPKKSKIISIRFIVTLPLRQNQKENLK